MPAFVKLSNTDDFQALMDNQDLYVQPEVGPPVRGVSWGLSPDQSLYGIATADNPGTLMWILAETHCSIYGPSYLVKRIHDQFILLQGHRSGSAFVVYESGRFTITKDLRVAQKWKQDAKKMGLDFARIINLTDPTWVEPVE